MNPTEQGLILAGMKSFLKRHLLEDLPRPHIIEFTGTPDSGKTTIINGVDSFLRNHGFRVRRPQEGAEVFRHISRKTPLYNMTTGAYGLQNVADATYSRDHDFILLDRALYDAYNWMVFWRNKAKLTPWETKEFQTLFTHPFGLSNIDLCFYVVCRPEEAMRRARSDASVSFESPDGSYTNEKTIAELIETCDEGYKDMCLKSRPVHWLDTTKISKSEMFEIVFEKVFESMAKRVRKGGK